MSLFIDVLNYRSRTPPLRKKKKKKNEKQICYYKGIRHCFRALFKLIQISLVYLKAVL